MNCEKIEVIKDTNKLISTLKNNGFDILEKYKIIEDVDELDDEYLKIITFELIENPFDTDYDSNGTISLLFYNEENYFKCQLQWEARTEKIDFSDYVKCQEYYYQYVTGFPNFECEDEYGSCDFGNFIDYKNKTLKPFIKNIVKGMKYADSRMERCMEVQDEIDEFEERYFREYLEIKFNKPYKEITDEELEGYLDECDGESFFNAMFNEDYTEEDFWNEHY